MTILNVFVARDRALVVTDAIGKSHFGQNVEISKMIPFVHANMIVSGAGNYGVMEGVFWHLMNMQAAQFLDFDRACRIIPGVIDTVYTDFVAAAASTQPPALVAPWQCLVIVGWSEQQGRMCGQKQQRGPGAKAFSQPSGIEPYILTPDAFTGQRLEVPDTPEKMMGCAINQVAYFRDNHPDFPAGGRFVVAEISRDSMTFTHENGPGT